MEIGKHYKVSIHGEYYYCVFVGAENGNHYLKDINGHLFCITNSDTFQTIQPTNRYNEELNEVNREMENKMLSDIITSAYNQKLLITEDTPLNQINDAAMKLAAETQRTNAQAQAQKENNANAYYMNYGEGRAAVQSAAKAKIMTYGDDPYENH